MIRRRFTVAMLVLLFALACGDSTGISPEELAGTWTATEFVFTNQANSSQSVDWIPLGASFTLTIRADTERDQPERALRLGSPTTLNSVTPMLFFRRLPRFTSTDSPRQPEFA